MTSRRGQMEPPLTASESAASASQSSGQKQQLLDLEVKEELYSMELARRAVARAAIHLGIESMSERTLDVLADVLLSYLSRTGSAMSHLVESSGRTSAHANVLDALQACEIVSAPAVQRVYVSTTTSASTIAAAGASAAAASAVAATTDVSTTGNATGEEAGGSKMGEFTGDKSEPAGTTGPLGKLDGTGHGAGSANQDVIAATSSADWKGLASFLFGPNWYEESSGTSGKNGTTTGAEKGSQKNPEKGSDNQDQSKQRAGGGKTGPSSPEEDKMDVDDDKAATALESSGKTATAKSSDKGDGDGAEHGDSSGGRGIGGKALAVSGSPEEESGTREAVSRRRQGWNAPFFDEVRDYPQASETCANPHALPARIGLSLHRKVDISEEEADEEEVITEKALEVVPDSVFGTSKMIRVSDDVDGPTSWGHLKRKKSDEDADDQDVDMLGDGSARPSKRIKIGEPKSGLEAKGGKVAATKAVPSSLSAAITQENPDPYKFAYVPSFYPRPPPTDRVMDRGRTVVDLSEAERHQRQKMLLKSASAAAVKSNPMVDRTEEEADDVRSSLVQLDQYQYWGSSWDSSSQKNSTRDMVVPIGRPQSVSRPYGDGSVPPAGTAPGQGQAADVPIVPINRASLSTVSRILEGSVDAATM